MCPDLLYVFFLYTLATGSHFQTQAFADYSNDCQFTGLILDSVLICPSNFLFPFLVFLWLLSQNVIPLIFFFFIHRLKPQSVGSQFQTSTPATGLLAKSGPQPTSGKYSGIALYLARILRCVLAIRYQQTKAKKFLSLQNYQISLHCP